MSGHSNSTGNMKRHILNNHPEQVLQTALEEEKFILGITIDNAANNGTFFNWLEEHGITADVSQIRCLAHAMNLSVQDMLTCLKSPFAEKLTEEVTFDDDDEEDEDELENEV
ncbi:hypothetical protein HA402_005749 [Bradysia odoriphaga]|nr:hypothetical protein HA402_005749 [Bradysia odoriphaga]